MDGAKVEIADSRGECHAYALRRLPPGLHVARYAILREDTGAAYEVRLGRGGAWSCSCPAWLFRHAPNRRHHAGSCKHVGQVQEIHRLLTQLGEPEAPHVRTP